MPDFAPGDRVHIVSLGTGVVRATRNGGRYLVEIKGATMVVAGVYLGARVYGVFWSGFNIGDGGFDPMAIIGAITIIIGAALAFVQTDIKKVLAYSTISQLGYMVMGLGVGAWVGAVFHLFTHAFFKALLFLGAGSVSHSGSHHSFEMK